jgi:hypothetical protein
VRVPEGQEDQSQQGTEKTALLAGTEKTTWTEKTTCGDLAKERVRTEKFQQLEQKNSNKVLGVSRC